MDNGDTAALTSGTYSCNDSSSNCAGNWGMITANNLFGSIECTESAGCILDGLGLHRVMWVSGTGGQTLTLRALAFKDGQATNGGGLETKTGALVDVVLCVFGNCKATGTSGGAIFVESSGTVVKIFGTSFIGNTADSRNGNDIYRKDGEITFHDICPPPYTAKTPTQGSALDTFGSVNGSAFSFAECFIVCPADYSTTHLATAVQTHSATPARPTRQVQRAPQPV